MRDASLRALSIPRIAMRRDEVAASERFSKLKVRGPRVKGFKEYVPVTEELTALADDHTFADALTAVLASAKSRSLHKFFENPLSAGEIFYLGSIRIRFTGPFPQAYIDISKNSEKRLVGLNLDYSEISVEMNEIIEWADKGHHPDESGDLRQSMEISGRTICALGELLRDREVQK